MLKNISPKKIKGKIKGKIVAFGDRLSVSKAKIRAGKLEAQSDDNGFFELTGFPENMRRINMIITHPDYSKREYNLTISELDAEEIKVIELFEGGTIQGTVINLDGSPVRNFKVFLGW